jgi:AsmA family protein
VNLAMAGATPKQLAASATGSVLLAAADMTLAGGTAAALDRNVLMTVLRLLIPKGAADQALPVQCMVVLLPLRRGVATIDRSIAAETREVAVVASGVINLVDQTLRLELRPSVKKGLGLNPANLATDFMEISGPLQNPHMGVGAKGAVRGAAKVGVGVATGGLSLLVPSVVGAAKDVSVCAQAAAQAPARPAARGKSKAGE